MTSLDSTFAALADPTRRAILARLASGEASVNELAGPFAMSQPAVSKHLKVLERAGSSPGDAMRSGGPPGSRRHRSPRPTPGWRPTASSGTESFEALDRLLAETRHRTAPRRRPNRRS